MTHARSPHPGWLVLLALCLAGGPGCVGTSPNTSLLPPLFTETRAAKIELKTLHSCSPLHSLQVVVATVTDAGGDPRRRRRVDWHLEGAGSIEASDDPGLFAGHPAVPKEEAGRVAVTYTDFLPHKIGRNLGHLTDDITIGPGQTWCVLTSAVEGESRVTATAPEINAPDSNHAAITQRWLDAEWTLPPAASGGSEAPLT